MEQLTCIVHVYHKANKVAQSSMNQWTFVSIIACDNATDEGLD